MTPLPLLQLDLPLAQHEVLRGKITPGLNGCWTWRACIDRRGRPRLWWKNRSRIANHVVYELIKGEVAEDQFVINTCGNYSCVNPEHHVARRTRTPRITEELSEKKIELVHYLYRSGLDQDKSKTQAMRDISRILHLSIWVVRRLLTP